MRRTSPIDVYGQWQLTVDYFSNTWGVVVGNALHDAVFNADETALMVVQDELISAGDERFAEAVRVAVIRDREIIRRSAAPAGMRPWIARRPSSRARRGRIFTWNRLS